MPEETFCNESPYSSKLCNKILGDQLLLDEIKASASFSLIIEILNNIAIGRNVGIVQTSEEDRFMSLFNIGCESKGFHLETRNPIGSKGEPNKLGFITYDVASGWSDSINLMIFPMTVVVGTSSDLLERKYCQSIANRFKNIVNDWEGSFGKSYDKLILSELGRLINASDPVKASFGMAAINRIIPFLAAIADHVRDHVDGRFILVIKDVLLTVSPNMFYYERFIKYLVNRGGNKFNVIFLTSVAPHLSYTSDEVAIYVLPSSDDLEANTFAKAFLELELDNKYVFSTASNGKHTRKQSSKVVDIISKGGIGGARPRGSTMHTLRFSSMTGRAVAGVKFDADIVAKRVLESISINKKNKYSGSTFLEMESTKGFDENSVGGYKQLMQWLKTRCIVGDVRARNANLKMPKGILLLGIPGCGKSLIAKSTGALFGWPVIKLNIGNLMTSLVGESERNTRLAIEALEQHAPCILWLDEIEKQFAGSTDISTDSGVIKRITGTILSWMQEHNDPVFIIATSNDVKSLPPEMLRKGRFDEVFFLDVPDDNERAEIFKIHIKKTGFDPAEYDIDEFVSVSDSLTGAEIESAVQDALYRAVSEAVTKNDETTKIGLPGRYITEALSEIKPLSKTMSDSFKDLRKFANNIRRAS